MNNQLARNSRSQLTIGEVLNALRGEFNDISISKIRFLESEGLIQPGRSESGYRKFTSEDIDRLRYVLRVQRDHYLPLKVIKDHLSAMDRGLEPPQVKDSSPQVPKVSIRIKDQQRKPVRLTEEEILKASSLDQRQLSDLERMGLVNRLPDGRHFDHWALKICKIAENLSQYGIDPRHLRAAKNSRDRELSLINQVTNPFTKRNHPEAIEKASEMKSEIAGLLNLLQSALLYSALEEDL